MADPAPLDPRSDHADFLDGGGELGALMRATDWSATALGPSEHWPQSLKTCIRIVLTSRQAMFVWWGEALTNLYNDAYRAILGAKHPAALGQPAHDVWGEIWDQVSPRAESAMRRNEGTFDERLLLIMHRNGYPEETYYTFSYSPVPGDGGATGGIICANSDETGLVVSERQLALLREQASATSDARTIADTCRLSARSLATNAHDLPFALIYLADAERRTATRQANVGIADDHPAAPLLLDLDDPTNAGWPIAAVVRNQTPLMVTGLAERFAAALPHGAWDRPPHQAAVLPLAPSGQSGLAGALVVGLNPYRLYDDAYQGFLALVATQIAAGIGNAQAYEEERRRVEALAEIDRAKTAFFSNVSHEFRTPLTLMLGPLEDAMARLDGQVRETEFGLIETAHRNGLRLLKLVNTLLDFSRIEAGRVQASFEPVDLAALTGELASNFRSACERAGLALVIDCPQLPEPVYVDRDIWEKIVLNLLSNAFKFTFEGSITVSLHPVGDVVELTVQDTGAGIAADELPRLFERFHRVRGVRGRSFEGSGIGLALVQELTRLHGGSIRVASEPGLGSAFTVAVPFGAAHLPPGQLRASPGAAVTGVRVEAFVEEALRWLPDADARASEAAAPRSTDEIEFGARFAPALANAGHRVVLADDNADMRAYVRGLLVGHGYTVEAVGDGVAAIEAARREPPDLVLTDVMMPGLDGFGVLATLRADPALADRPVILLSARAGEDARIEGLDAGADDYLTKPFAARELLARVGANLTAAQLRREGAAALRARTAELETLLETAPVAVWFTGDPEASHAWGNREASVLLRLPIEANPSLTAPEPGRPSHFRVFRDGEEVAPEMLPLQLAARGEQSDGDELELRFDDGTVRVLLARAAPVRGADGTPTGAVLAALDITDRKAAETALQALNETLEARVAERTDELAAANKMLVAQIEERERVETTLRQMQRLEAVGQLTSGVAHDFNNLLTVILGNLEFAARSPAVVGDARLTQRVSYMRKAAEQAAALTGQLLAFSRRQRLEPKQIDLNQTVAGMSDLLSSSLGAPVRLTTKLSDDLWPALVDATQIELVILNLTINARDAMDAGGNLTIETANARLTRPPMRPGEPPPGEYVTIAVSDTGTGMSETVRAKAFEPFFTTKEVGKGSGLGLAQVLGFAEQSGGGVAIETIPAPAPGHGTTVRVYLPRGMPAEAGRRAAVPAVEAVGAEDASRRRRILLADDDSAVREVTAAILEGDGYSVLDVGSGGAALEVLDAREDIDLLVLDFAMPGMNGAEVAREARKKRADLPILFVTGYADAGALREVDDERIVRKPFRDGELAAKVRAALAVRC